jgi:hypothetical protein
LHWEGAVHFLFFAILSTSTLIPAGIFVSQCGRQNLPVAKHFKPLTGQYGTENINAREESKRGEGGAESKKAERDILSFVQSLISCSLHLLSKDNLGPSS